MDRIAVLKGRLPKLASGQFKVQNFSQYWFVPAHHEFIFRTNFQTQDDPLTSSQSSDFQPAQSHYKNAFKNLRNWRNFFLKFASNNSPQTPGRIHQRYNMAM